MTSLASEYGARQLGIDPTLYLNVYNLRDPRSVCVCIQTVYPLISGF
jgi:hypothetical protein